MTIYQRLMRAYGPRHWWPADTPFEVAVGAILTQNTNWRNVERAIAALREADLLDARALLDADEARLQALIRPAGFFRQKSERLRVLAGFWLASGGARGLSTHPLAALRRDLLALRGVGPETADSILLYALEKPAFVIDTYTRRIFSRLGLCAPETGYDALQRLFVRHLPADVALFNEYHALIVEHAKRHCRVRPRCEGCPLASRCREAAHVD